MSNIDWSIVANISMPIISLFIGAGLNHFLERRAKVISYLGHVSGITLSRPEGPVIVNTHSVVLRNAGKQAATNVRLGHLNLPDFQIYPDIEYTVRSLPGGQKEIVIPTLIPTKEITISYLYFPPLLWNQINTHVETDTGPVQVIRVLPTAQPPQWAIIVSWSLIVYGFIALLYTIWVLSIS